MSTRAFSSAELATASILALGVQIAFLVLLIFAGSSRGAVKEELILLPNEIPIAVQPVLDERPLLKLGSKDPVKPRLPDMWKKREPRPVKRYEERSAPSEKAEDSEEAIVDSELADKTHKAPKEDDEIVEKVDDRLEDPEEEVEEEELDEEGAADGSEEGTETDPLKARQVDLYRMKIASWFSARFVQPDSIPCEVLKGLGASASVQVGGSRNITGFTITSPSGHPTFDGKVNATLSSLVGQQLPPPPPLYPDILGSVVYPRLTGRCE